MVVLLVLTAASSPEGLGEARADAETAQGEGAAGKENTLRTVPFVTLRNRTGSQKPSKVFGDERSSAHAGYCDVSRTPIKSLKPLADKVSIFIPEDKLRLEAIRERSVEDFWRDMEKSANGRRPVLYVHGFYISFDKGCKRASMFQEALGLEGRFVLFSWPSDGAMLNYTLDEADLYWSVAPLEETLTDMVGRFGAGNIDIVAHSLGTRGVFLALVNMARAGQLEEPLVNQVVLVAPDIDTGIFEQYLPRIRPLVQNITIYASANDRPLSLSQKVHGHPRLGESGPHLEGLTGVEIIDLSDIPVRYPSGHVYHLYHDFAIDDLTQLLIDGKPASTRSHLEQTGKNHWRLLPESARPVDDSN